MKRICIVCDGHWDQLQGGAEYQLDLLGRALAERGYDVHYVCYDRGTSFRPSPVNIIPLSLSGCLAWAFYPYQLLLAPQLYRVLDELKPDIILNRVGSALTGLCARYGVSRDVPTVWHVANITDLIPMRWKLDRTLFMGWLDKKLMEYGIRKVDRIIVQAHYQCELLAERFKRNADLMVANFHPPAQGQPTQSDPSIVLWVANVKPKKNPEAFLTLAEQFAGDASVRFVMVGRAWPGGYQDQIEKRIAFLENAKYLGEISIDEVNSLMGQASIFVNTSEVEGFPNTFIQAWLRKVPVVSLQFDPDDVLVTHGLGFHSGTSARMYEDVKQLLEHPEIRREIGSRALAYAEEVHGIDANVGKVIELIESC